MASSGEMVTAMAGLFDLPVATVESIDRVLSDAGLRKKGGRGRSAAQMTGIDIANLTFALILGVGMKDAPSAVAKVTAMPRKSADVQWDADLLRLRHNLLLPPEQDLSTFAGGRALADAPTLGEGIAALIDAMAAGEFGDAEEMQINFQMTSRGPAASLTYWKRKDALRVEYEAIGPDISRPVFERQLKLDEISIRHLADVIRPS